MSRLLEDLLCGMVGYGIGKHHHRITKEEAEETVISFLREVPLEGVIRYWMQFNGYSENSFSIAYRLRDMAEEMDR